MCERLDPSALLAEPTMPVLEAIGGAGAIVGIVDVSLRAVSEICRIIGKHGMCPKLEKMH